jgi:hypothetical protein
MISRKLKNCFHCGTAGAAAGASVFAGMGSIIVSGMGSSFNVSLVPFMVIGAGAVLAAYGFIELGRWMANREQLPTDGDEEELYPLRRYPKAQPS